MHCHIFWLTKIYDFKIQPEIVFQDQTNWGGSDSPPRFSLETRETTHLTTKLLNACKKAPIFKLKKHHLQDMSQTRYKNTGPKFAHLRKNRLQICQGEGLSLPCHGFMSPWVLAFFSPPNIEKTYEFQSGWIIANPQGSVGLLSSFTKKSVVQKQTPRIVQPLSSRKHHLNHVLQMFCCPSFLAMAQFPTLPGFSITNGM